MSRRKTIDAWIDAMMRRAASISMPASATGLQLQNMQRVSRGASGKQHPIRGPLEDVIGSDGETIIGRHRPQLIKARGGGGGDYSKSGAFAALVSHAQDAKIWSMVPMIGRIILTMQRTAVLCPGGGAAADQLRGEEGPQFGCPTCGARFSGEAVREINWIFLEEAVRETKWTNRSIVPSHALTVPISRERRLAEHREGDGEDVDHLGPVRNEDGTVTDFYRMWAREPVMLTNPQIAERLGISLRQLERHVAAARRMIGRELDRITAVEEDDHGS